MKIGKSINLLIAVGIICIAMISRFIPHPPNFTAVGAIGLFGAAHFSRKWMAFLLPVLALWGSDLLLNNIVYAEFYDSFQWIGSLYVYAAFVMVIGLGVFLLQKINIKNLVLTSLVISIVFFLVTNFGVWKMGLLFPKTLEGLLATYIAAIPFFWSTLAGNVFYSLILFKVYDWIKADQKTVIA